MLDFVNHSCAFDSVMLYKKQVTWTVPVLTVIILLCEYPVSYLKPGSTEKVTVDESEMEVVWTCMRNNRLTLWCSATEVPQYLFIFNIFSLQLCWHIIYPFNPKNNICNDAHERITNRDIPTSAI